MSATSAVLAFRVTNHRSLRDEQELSMVRSNRFTRAAEEPRDSNWDPTVNTVAGIYGGNASGKSNLLSAVNFLVTAVKSSHSRWEPDDLIPVDPFRLDSTRSAPSTYEIEFLLEGVRYQYGFRVDRERVLAEWLYAYPRTKRRVLFERDSAETPNYYFGSFLTGRNQTVAEVTRSNSLFLSAAATTNHAVLGPVAKYLRSDLKFANPLNTDSRLRFTLELLKSNESVGPRVLDLLRVADLGICDINVLNRSFTDEERERMLRILEAVSEPGTFDPAKVNLDDMPLLELQHQCTEGKPVSLPLDEESVGTRALVALTGPILDVLTRGRTLFVDEIDTSLHPRLVSELVALFKNPDTNPRQAQLVFTSHDTSLLGNVVSDEPLLDRDQIWLAEKNQRGATEVYPLTDFKPRRAENLERGYLQGRYGGVPVFGSQDLALAIEHAVKA